MILSRYIAKRFFWAFAQVFGTFFAILLLIDTVEQLRRLSPQGLGAGAALQLALLNTPTSLYRILPLIMVLAAILLFLALSRSSELVVIRAAGRSAFRFMIAPLVVALLLGGVSVALFNPIVAATQKQYDKVWARMTQNGEHAMSLTDEGLWLRQGGKDGQTVIHADRSNAEGTELFGVTFHEFAADGTPKMRIETQHAVLGQGAWLLDDAKQWDMGSDNPERDAKLLPKGSELESNLTREGIRDSIGDPTAVPFWGLPAYIHRLEQAGFSAKSYRVWYQMELAAPLLFAAMVLIGAAFCLRHARFGKTGVMVLLAVLCGFMIFFLRNFAQILGNNGQIPVGIAAWTAPVAALLIGLSLLVYLEDG